MTFEQTNFGTNAKLNQTSFSGTALLLAPLGEDYTMAATAQDCCASCAQSVDASLIDPTTVAYNDTVDYLEDKKWFQGCNLFNWCALYA